MDKTTKAPHHHGKALDYHEFFMSWESFETPVTVRPMEPQYAVMPEGDSDAEDFLRLYREEMDD